MHPGGGGIAAGSVKQKLNTRSSTMAELVAVDDFLSKVLWVRNFHHARELVFKVMSTRIIRVAS